MVMKQRNRRPQLLVLVLPPKRPVRGASASCSVRGRTPAWGRRRVFRVAVTFGGTCIHLGVRGRVVGDPKPAACAGWAWPLTTENRGFGDGLVVHP